MAKYRTAFITGASSGIGRELALLAASKGVEVALAARRGDELERVAGEIHEAGGSARVYQLDVSRPLEAQEVIQRADDEMGGLDLVVANAGVETGRWSGKLRWKEDCEGIIDVNVAGVVATLTAITYRMVERKRGHLAATSSLAGYKGLPRWAMYSASKAFVSTFLESLRVDLRATGVSVTDIRPGYVRTPLTAEVKRPLPFMVDVEDAAAIIWKGLSEGRRIVEFPWQLALTLRTARTLPAALYDPISKKIL